MTQSTSGATGTVVDRVRHYRLDTLPPDVVTIARHCVLDWFSVAIAGSREPVSQLVRQEIAERGSGSQATIVGSSTMATDVQAALCNGVAAHALDYDDVLETMLGHPTAPTLSAALAVGERQGRSGAEILTAFIAGVEAESQIGRMVEPGHHEAGWHTTGTLGAFGAAAAVAHLYRLDRDEWLHAFGLAGAQAAGLKAGFGTMAKPFHAGHAAASGVLAASLARRGMTTAPNVIEADRGFADATTNTFNARVLDGRGHDEFDLRGILFKRHASCYLTDSLIEGLLALRADPRLTLPEITAIRLHVLPVHLTTCAIDEPQTGLQAKFSMRFLAALALVAGRANPSEFTPRWLADPDVRALSALVQIIPDHTGPTMATPVEVELSRRRVLRRSIDMGATKRRIDLAGQQQMLRTKFDSLAVPVIGTSRAAELVDRVEAFDQLPHVGELMECVRGGDTDTTRLLTGSTP
jgi:2-methylcitrate dehydratase PrpD